MPILALQQDSDEESSDGSEQRLQDDRAGMSKGATEAITAMAHPFVLFSFEKTCPRDPGSPCQRMLGSPSSAMYLGSMKPFSEGEPGSLGSSIP